ncbi:MAG TPA: hypothetical protein VI159_03525 [Gemmatimonadales bacterium]|nr:hypothetical protein [Gemmatimonadales bacterium]
MSAGRPREKILENLESVYREAYDRAKTAGDERRMADLDAAYQREQLLLEVLLDIRDGLTSRSAPAAPAPSGPDPIAVVDTIRRISQLR